MFVSRSTAAKQAQDFISRVPKFVADPRRDGDGVAGLDVAFLRAEAHPAVAVGQVINLLGPDVIVLLRGRTDRQPGFRERLLPHAGVAVREQFADFRAVLGDEGRAMRQGDNIHSRTDGRGTGFAKRQIAFRCPQVKTLRSMQHSPGFLALVNDAKSRIQEISIDALRQRLVANPHLILLDVREANEWAAGHAAQAAHLGKGILERDLETLYPDQQAEIILYCGGGFRSALSCDAAQKMGYTHVRSLIGGYKGLVAANWEIQR